MAALGVKSRGGTSPRGRSQLTPLGAENQPGELIGAVEFISPSDRVDRGRAQDVSVASIGTRETLGIG